MLGNVSYLSAFDRDLLTETPLQGDLIADVPSLTCPFSEAAHVKRLRPRYVLRRCAALATRHTQTVTGIISAVADKRTCKGLGFGKHVLSYGSEVPATHGAVTIAIPSITASEETMAVEGEEGVGLMQSMPRTSTPYLHEVPPFQGLSDDGGYGRAHSSKDH
ncbi:hypothetical protein SKAU_G00398010 [Synaphobranchus kaupii]|uniref:Uncharacterized protein n=1 Tax=Synaphobranchus kaupii TaxID=118154 RepID=A0A9Q1E8M1_SYNKA|nr:hypothetical protein SKAU_G00398010 [Synaphobranchus kaupii]